MSKAGTTLTNPITGDTYEFLETAIETQGKSISIKVTIKGKGKFVPNHIHAIQDEAIEVVTGTMTVWEKGKMSTLKTGEKILLPKNEPHNHYNMEDVPLTFIQTLSPALDFQQVIETIVGLSSDGKSKKGRFGLLQEMVSLKYFESETYLASIPKGLQRFLMRILAPLGRKMGYRAVYKKYSGIEK